jgi:hypothetical protein
VARRIDLVPSDPSRVDIDDASRQPIVAIERGLATIVIGYQSGAERTHFFRPDCSADRYTALCRFATAVGHEQAVLIDQCAG